MGSRVHYPAEIKWKVVEMKNDGYTNKFIMEELGIKDKSQIKTWMRWYRNNETHRFEQPVGKQYRFGKGQAELSELEAVKLKNRQLETQLEILKKQRELERSWYHK